MSIKSVISLLLIGLSLYSCKGKHKDNSSDSGKIEDRSTESSTYKPTYTNGSSNQYKYNNRTRGVSGNYDYNYDVSGDGENGYVSGNIDIEGKYGSGYLEDEEGNEISVDVEWVDYGVLEATDEDGNTYDLEVD